MTVNLVKLHETPMDELIQQAQNLGISNGSRHRGDLVFAIAREQGSQSNQDFGRGVLEVHSEGFGFLRSPDQNFLPGPEDIYVSQSQIRRFKLQTGDTVIGLVRPPKEGERYTALLRVESVNGDPPGVEPPTFESLTAIYPDERISLGDDAVLKALDFVAPLGLGQRGMLIAPTRTGRVDLLRKITNALASDDELEVCVLLMAERPEEIHEWKKSTKAEVIATHFDDHASRHIQVADIVFERARRMVERGDDVVIVIDSLNRLLHASLADPGTTSVGRTLYDVDLAALVKVKRLVASARALEEGGSLTIIGVVSGDPSHPFSQALRAEMDDIVNWQVSLSTEVAAQCIHPAIDVSRSGTLRSEQMLDEQEIQKRQKWRATLKNDKVLDAQSLLKQ